jgi:hypothetical protein
MKERPMLFNAPMAGAILAGQKTVTRRAVAPQPGSLYVSFGTLQNDPHHGFGFHDGESFWKSPYGQPGDRLWVRETWQLHEKFTDNCVVVYRASERKSWTEFHRRFPVALSRGISEKPFQYGWRPSIHMPRWACRTLLEITAVRVERLHDMKAADCIAEGCAGGHDSIPDYDYSATPGEHFRHVWESTGGDYFANPWVWVIEFKRVEVIHD